MKPTTLTALALTLLMFLLVLLAAFFFVFQGQVSLRNDLAEEQKKVDTIQEEQATLKLNHSILQEEATRMFYEGATAASESVVLTEQLANTAASWQPWKQNPIHCQKPVIKPWKSGTFMKQSVPWSKSSSPSLSRKYP